MHERTWTPGGYPSAVTDRGVFVLEPGNEALAQRFWELMLDGADLYVLLQELTSAFAANLASLPSFVAIIDEGLSAHIAVRGVFEVVVDGSEGPTSLAGGSVITWSEHRIGAHSGWRIATPVDGIRNEETQWRVVSAVLPVSTLASGTVGEVASPIVDSSAAVFPVAEASPALGAPVSSGDVEAGPEAVSVPVSSPTDLANEPLGGKESGDDSPDDTGTPWGEGASSVPAAPAVVSDDVLHVAEAHDSPAAAFFAAAAADYDADEPAPSEPGASPASDPAPIAEEAEVAQPDASDPAPLIEEPAAPGLVEPESAQNGEAEQPAGSAPISSPAGDEPEVTPDTGGETLTPWYERGNETLIPADEETELDQASRDEELGQANQEKHADPEIGSVSSPYEYLYDDVTRTGCVEDAAVRQIRNSDVIDDDPVPPPPPVAFSPAPSEEANAASDPSVSAPDQGTHVSPAPVSPAPAQPDVPFTPPAGGFFIDSVPGISSGTAPKAAPPSRHPLMEAPADGDHDGLTTLPARARELRDYARQFTHAEPEPTPVQPSRQEPTPSAPSPSSGVGPQVLAVLCEKGHPNATHASSCRICSSPLSNAAVQVPRPDLGRIILSTGEEIRLDRDIVIGRRPRSSTQSGRAAARMVIVPSPGKQISRSHCELRIDDWDVRLHDLGSNNGTYLTRPGQAAVRLDESVPMVLKPGDVVELGENISFRMED